MNPCSTQTLVNKDVCTHMSPAMRALTQLTRAGVSVCYSLKLWHAQAAILSLHNKTCQCQTEWLQWLCTAFLCSDLWSLDLEPSIQSLSCPKGEPDSCC